MSNRNTKGQLTQSEVGAMLGITRARVHQIEKRALLKMRRALDGMEVTYDILDLDDTGEARATRWLQQEFAVRAEQ